MKAITRAQDRTDATSDPTRDRIGKCPAPDVGTSLDDILNMRVGCWRPPVYVNDRPVVPDLRTRTAAGIGLASARKGRIKAIPAVTC